MAVPRSVKGFISLLVFTLIIWLPSEERSQQSSSTEKKDKIKSARVSISQEKKKVIENLKKNSPCLKLKKNVEILVAKEAATIHWKNHYLQKNGIEYNLRLERDYNQQGYQVQRAKLFQLDSDGFPSFIKEKIIKDESDLKEMMSGYKYITDNSVISFNDESLLVEKEQQTIIKVTNLLENQECHFMAHHR